MTNGFHVDAELSAWENVAEQIERPAILIGNGASCAIWDRFRYQSLYERACQEDLEHYLSVHDRALFANLNTTNFEAVLGALATTKLVNRALGIQSDLIEERYQSIQASLASAVRAVHIPWLMLTDDRKAEISRALRQFEFVFSTNYDLLVYWAMMHENAADFRDYFFGGEQFDVSNTEIWGERTKVLYLHGGLHLYTSPTGGTFKRPAVPWTNLLELFGTPYRDSAVPLIVSEGSSDEKIAAISRSDYLTFAHSQFSSCECSLVVFGHSLGETDEHLVRAMRNWRNRRIAVSLLPAEPRHIVARKAALHERLPNADLLFFDASTHPLGRPELQIAAGEGLP